MSAFDIAEGRILTALFIAHHAEHRQILTWDELEARYHTNVSKMHFEAIVAELERRGVVKVFRDKDGSGVLLLDHGIRFAHDRILAFLDATTFDVNWKTERILTDALEDVDVPCPEGWMLLHVNNDKERGNAPQPKSRQAVAAKEPAPSDASVNEAAARPHNAPDGIPSHPESSWVKWQTILTAAGVVIAIIAIIVAT